MRCLGCMSSFTGGLSKRAIKKSCLCSFPRSPHWRVDLHEVLIVLTWRSEYHLRTDPCRSGGVVCDILKAKGYPFTCKIFEDMGHGGLIGENTERFIKEVDAVHRQSKKETEKRV